MVDSFPSPAPPIVDIRRVTRQFGAKTALNEVTLTIPRGGVFGLIGGNGAGKTTLIKHLLGLLKAQYGSVRVFGLDPVENPDDAARLMDQGSYDLVVTTRTAGAAGRETVYQRLNRLSPDTRRRHFVVLVGDEFKTGDGTQAWAVLADMVIAARDIPNADSALLPTLAERTRLYQVFQDARKRFEASAG